jgi:hypothetical protein
MSRRADQSLHADSGAALILAIGFVLMVSAIGAGLFGLVISSLNNGTTLEMVRDRQYAAEGAVQDSIAQVRQQTGSPLAACTAAGGSLVAAPMNDTTIRVEWSSACRVVAITDGTLVAQRNVIFSACEVISSPTTPCTEAGVIVRAQVNFEQRSTGAVTDTFVQSWSVNR